MGKSGSEASDDFEYVETPAAPITAAPSEDYGVRTTSVRDSTALVVANLTNGGSQLALETLVMKKLTHLSVVPINQECSSTCGRCRQ